MASWTPATAGTGFAISPTLRSLEPFKDKLVVISNLKRAGGAAEMHAAAACGWLSGAIPKRTEAEDYRIGTTIDQVLAKQLGQDSPFPSLEFATEDFTGYVGGCTPGFSCAYMNTISWASPTTPLPMEISPRNAFERLFGDGGSAPSAAPSCSRTRASSTRSSARRGRCTRGWGPAIAPGSATTSTTSARSSGASSRSRRRTAAR